MFTPLVLLTLIVFLPALAAIVLAFVPSKQHDLLRYITLGATVGLLQSPFWISAWKVAMFLTAPSL